MTPNSSKDIANLEGGLLDINISFTVLLSSEFGHGLVSRRRAVALTGGRGCAVISRRGVAARSTSTGGWNGAQDGVRFRSRRRGRFIAWNGGGGRVIGPGSSDPFRRNAIPGIPP